MRHTFADCGRGEAVCIFLLRFTHVGRARADQVTVRDGAVGRVALTPHDFVAQRRLARTAGLVAETIVSEPWSCHGAARAGAPRLEPLL